MLQTTRLLRDLVALPSVNPMGRVLPEEITLEHRVTSYLEDVFRGLGVAYYRQPVAAKRENIIARCDRSGAGRTLIFEAHQDTVPIDNMIVAPFGAVIEDGRLYGRGACDIKGGLAAMLAAFGRVVHEKPPAAANLVMACTVDEEHTFLGVQELVRSGIKGNMAVVAEPTMLNIVNAHKGVARWILTAPGRSCHSSSPEQGINAIYRMARLLGAIEKYATYLRETTVDPLLGPATMSVGRIEGGTSVNTVPDRCHIEMDRRLVRGETPAQATAQLKDFLASEAAIDFPFECPTPWMSMPALDSHGSDLLIAQLGQAIDKQRGGHRVHAVPYGTDASTLSAAGIPSVVFGPGDIAKAHTNDEWVSLDDVEAASEILFRLAASAG
jgi:acetylornithine deacetylase/succinyl-diaminopimelate desuccinylase family protein